MAITVRTGTGPGVSVQQGASGIGSITVNKSTGGKLQSLSDVESTGVQDGFTIVYNESINKWVTQAITTAVASIDGGIY